MDICSERQAAAPVATAAVKRFLAQPYVHKARTWCKLFGAAPPRGVVARLARRFNGSLHPSVEFYNFSDSHSFRQEVRRLMRWYSKVRKRFRWRRGI
eukprot:5847809-Karenia_brevis.AAC.1